MVKKCLLKALACLLCYGSIGAYAQETPPATWQEHWFEHNQVVTRVFLDADIAVYYDNDVDRNITWMNKFAGDVWRYTKRTYGDFGGKPHLYAIFHAYKYGGGHPSTWWDAHHDYRNVIDIGQAGDWHSQSGWNIDVIAHEISHIVELGSKGVHGSPAFGLWGDSKWAEIFNYDVYLNLGMTSVAQSTYNDLITKQDNFPRAGTYWFRDWFYPIYSQYGGNKVLNRYFELLARHFPKNGNNYSRSMNWGEFVHFWSGAAGVDLKPLATNAFGWPAEWETQYNKAKTDFVFTTTPPTPTTTSPVTTYQHCDFGGKATAVPVGSHNLSQLQAFGFVNDDASSVKVLPGYKVLLFKDNNFTGTQLTLTGNDTCLVDNGFNDAATSLQVKSNGDTSLSGRYFLRNRNSGLYLDVSNSNLNNGAKIQQWTYNGTTAQQFEFSHQGEGVYIIRGVVSGKALDVDAISTNDGVKVQLWDYLGTANQRFIAYKSGSHYQLIATHSSKAIKVAGNSANSGAAVEQWQNNSESSSEWELIRVTTNPGFSLLKQAESYSSMSGIGLEGTTDTGGGQNVGWIETNDWLMHNTITIPASGNYTIEYRVASPNNGGRLSMDLNSGSIVLGERDIPNTGSWQTWTTVSHTVYINAGTYNFRILAKASGWNINWFRIVSQ